MEDRRRPVAPGEEHEGAGPGALSLPPRIVGRFLASCVQAAVDFLIEDLCALCPHPRHPEAAGTPGPYSSHFLEPVTVSLLGILPLRNHPVCERCAAGLEPAAGAGLLGTASPSGMVTTTRGERFGTPGVAPAGRARRQIQLPITAPFMTNDNALKIIHLIKFGGYDALIPAVASAVRDAFGEQRDVAQEGTVLVATPGEAGARRRLNLPERMAELLSRELDIPLIKNTLTKTKRTARQSQTPHEHRGRNVRGAFACTGSKLAGKRVVLVDDLVTTGATAASCGAAILGSGAAALEVVCFARAL